MCFAFLASSTTIVAKDGDKKKEEPKKETKECKDDSCKRPTNN